MTKENKANQAADKTLIDKDVTGSPNVPQNPVSLAEMDLQQAQDLIFIVPADDEGGKFTLKSDASALLRAELQAWLQQLRDAGKLLTELISTSARDQNVRQMTQQLLAAAYAAPAKCWMTALPTGRQLVIAPATVVERVGFEGVCRVAHERAIRVAQACGKPFNSVALAHYQNQKPREAT